MSRIHAYTIVAANYLPKARVLFRSLRRWRPEWRLHLVLADVRQAPEALAPCGPDEIHYVSELGIPHWRPWAFSHSCIELATALKPFVLRRLLARPDCSAALYFDPDIAVFSPLDEIVASFDAADILLTPHLTVPERSLNGVIDNEICTSQHGIYNLGFIGVAARLEGRALADWWADRLYRFCREDFQDGIYTDQRWIDFVPAFFDRVRILRAPNLNVAPWNLGNRHIEGDVEAGFTVNGVPLGFYHFSQVDSAANDPATASQPSAMDLLRWYRAQIAPMDAEAAVSPWGFGAFEDGTPIRREQRIVYRLRVDLQNEFPDPFRAGTASYADWWRRHARREFPFLFNGSDGESALRRLLRALIYGRTVAEIQAEFQHGAVPGQVGWLDERQRAAR